MKKVYLDYNIWDLMFKNSDIELFFKSLSNFEFYLSVAHFEELFHARNNETDKYIGTSDKLKEFIFSKAKSGILVPASCDTKKGIEYDDNNIRRKKAVNDIEIEHNTQEIVKEIALKQQTQYGDFLSKGIENISSELLYKEIWNNVHVKERIKKYNERANKVKTIIAYECMSKEWREQYPYNYETQILAEKYIEAQSQIIDKDIYSEISNNYFKLEYVIGALYNILSECGFKNDKSCRTVISSQYDVQHSIMSTYCDIFITHDKKFKEKYKAIAYYLGIPIKILYYQNNKLIK